MMSFLPSFCAILIRTDMGPTNASQIVEEIHKQFRARVVHLDDVLSVIKEQLKQLLEQDESPLRMSDDGLTVIMVCGVNGSGKTTSIAKLAHLFRSQGKTVILGAGDTFRAAAVEQLSIWARRLGVEVVTGASGSDPASVGASCGVDRRRKWRRRMHCRYRRPAANAAEFDEGIDQDPPSARQ